jgi:AraC family transcriptional regulator
MSEPVYPADASLPTFQEWYARPLVQPLTSSESLGWSDIQLHTSRIRATKEDVTGPLTDNHCIVFQLRGETRIQCRLGDAVFDEGMTPGAMALVPAQYQNVGRWSHSIFAAFIQLSPKIIDRLADYAFGGDPELVEFQPKLNLHDPVVESLLTELRHELRQPSPLSAVFAESAAQTMMLHLLRKYSNKAVHLRSVRDGFSERQRRVIDDYIESHLDEKISLAELASLLFMSVPHFERVFRRTLGCAPYQYVLERRLERARLLLETSALNMYEVGRQCGFANQSHFTRHFTKRYGVSPAKYRYGRD